MKFITVTLGCKVNQYESNVLRASFEKEGFEYTDKHQTPDLIIVNSCTVTAESDRKTRQTVRKMRRSYPDSIIVLTGCMPQASHKKGEDMLEADIVTGNRSNDKILLLVKEYIAKRQRCVFFEEHEKDEEFSCSTVTDFYEKTRAFLKIEDGCENYCTYCIIPKARGIVRSKPLDVIKSEALALAEKGYKEIVLVGINLSAYGRGTTYDLCDAVYTVSDIDGIERIRLGSVEPDLMTDEFMKKLSANKKFCPQFHLSLQSGCDETLKRMNRHYNTAFYRDLVNRIRSNFVNPSITTDIMVGFAGETDDEFEQNRRFAGEIGFARAHVFVYSKREGTFAATLKDQVSDDKKSLRAKLMSETVKKTEKEFLESQVGLVCPVLFETRQKDKTYEGYTENYTQVVVKSDCSIEGRILNVKITEAKDTYCLGELI